MPMKQKNQRVERAIFYWVKSKKDGKQPESHETITHEEIAREFGLPRFVLLKRLSSDVDEGKAFRSLPFTLMLVISYSFMAIQHMDATTARAVEDSVAFDIEDNANFAFDGPLGAMGHKNIDDVSTFVDFYSFTRNGLMPLLFQQEYPQSEYIQMHFPHNDSQPLPQVEWSMLTTYNRIVGGVRYRQERGTYEACSVDTLMNFYGRMCTKVRLNYEKEPEYPGARDFYPDTSKDVWFWVWEPLEMVEERLLQLELENWLDELTEKVEIGIPIYNAEYGVHAYMTVNFYFSRAGHIWKKIIPQMCYASWFTSVSSYFFDFLYVCCMIWMAANEILEIAIGIRSFGFVTLCKEYFNMFNVVDWVSIITGTALLQMFGVLLFATSDLNDSAIAVGNIPRPYDNVTADQQTIIVDYVDLLEYTVKYTTTLQFLLSLYPLIIVFRLFKAFHAQPRLGLVTMTIGSAMTNLVHFLIVFACVFFGFVTSGVVLFGREVEEMSSMPYGTYFCFRLLLGAIDFDELKVVGYIPAGLWLMGFMVVAALILMNMLLAIVMDAYTCVKNDVGNAETLVEELIDQVKAAIAHYRGKDVPLGVVLKAIEERTDPSGHQHALSAGSMRRSTSKLFKEDVVEGYSWEREMISVASLISMVYDIQDNTGKCGARRQPVELSEEQAVQIMVSGIEDYFQAKKKGMDLLKIVITGDQIHRRAKKAAACAEVPMTNTGHGHANMKSAMVEMREDVTRFLEDVEHDRKLAVSEVSRLRLEVACLRGMLRQVLPEGSELPSPEIIRRPHHMRQRGSDGYEESEEQSVDDTQAVGYSVSKEEGAARARGRRANTNYVSQLKQIGVGGSREEYEEQELSPEQYAWPDDVSDQLEEFSGSEVGEDEEDVMGLDDFPDYDYDDIPARVDGKGSGKSSLQSSRAGAGVGLALPNRVPPPRIYEAPQREFEFTTFQDASQHIQKTLNRTNRKEYDVDSEF